MIRGYIFIAVVSFASISSAAPFALDAENCAITSESVVALAIGNEKLESKIRAQLVMSGDTALFPRLRITFLSHEPAKATIEWSSIVHSKKNVKLFRSEIFDRVVQRQGQQFSMKRVSAAGQRATFETDVVSMQSTQDIMALFLSQNEFTVHAFTDEGDDWAGDFSLSMSDSSFRQMAVKCFAAKSAKYLTPNGERADLKLVGVSDKNSLAAMPYYWSEGYGLTPYTELELLVPSELKGKDVFAATDSEETKSKKLSTWIGNLERKKAAVAALDAQGSDLTFVAINSELAGLYSQLDQSYSRFVVLTGTLSAGDGLIQKKMSEQEALKLALADVEAKIQSANLALDPLLKDQTATDVALHPFLEYLTNVDALKEKHAARISEIIALQAHLQEMLSRHQAALTTGQQTPPTAGPWSAEEIEKREAEATLQLLKAQELAVLQERVQAIVGDMNGLLEKARAQQALSLEYLTAVAQQRSVKAELAQEETWLYQSSQVPRFTVAAKEFFDNLNTVAETEVAQAIAKTGAVTRDYKWEFDFHSNMYNAIETQFVEIVELSKRDGSLISAILCHPNVLKDEKNRTQPCLTVDDILDEKIVENFLSTLPPKDVDVLLGTVPRPWNKDQSKTQILVSKYQGELARPSARLQEMVDAWGALRQVIWRWVTMQKKAKALDVCEDRDTAAALFATATYSREFYDKVITCERAEVQTHKARKKELLSTLAATTAAITQANASFQQADEAYDVASQDFVNGSMARLKEIPALTRQTRIMTTCLLPLENAEECASAVDEITSGKLTAEAQGQYVGLVQALVSHIYSRITLLGQENAVAVSEIQRLDQERAAYVATNNVTPLLEKRDQLKLQIQTSQTELAELVSAQKQNTESLATAQKDVSTFKTEAQALIAELTTITTAIKGTLPALMPFCARILPHTHRIHQMDVELFALVNTTPPAQAKKYSSCEIPNLENYIPAPGALELTGEVKR